MWSLSVEYRRSILTLLADDLPISTVSVKIRTTVSEQRMENEADCKHHDFTMKASLILMLTT